MNTKTIDAIAKAVLYEGYMLYPYRASSVKNRQRFNFGVLYPRSYSEAQAGSDAWSMQTECLIQGSSPGVEVKVRFLKIVTRTVLALAGSQASQFLSDGSRELASAPPPWQEAIECEVDVPIRDLNGLSVSPLPWAFALSAREETEPLRDPDGRVVGMIARKQESVCGIVEIRAHPLRDQLFKLQVRVANHSPLVAVASPTGRDAALMRSLVSAHTLLGIGHGEFISLLEPADDVKDLARSCQNIGTWPVLVGAQGERDTMLSSPIILYDYPQVAPESPGELFDGTEIDEILALRIMTMTEDEKREMRNTDERARQILERTESLPVEQLRKLHGTLRDVRALAPEVP
jgi:hypothetical protein